MDMMTPTSQPGAAPIDEGEGQGTDPNQVILAKLPDGSFTCNGAPAKTIEDVLAMAREKLTGNDGGMSVEQAFQGGFKGSDVGPGAGY
jgi:hypothetical protein